MLEMGKAAVQEVLLEDNGWVPGQRVDEKSTVQEWLMSPIHL